MSGEKNIVAWIRRALGIADKPGFAQVLDDAMETPFVTLSAQALEQSMLHEEAAHQNDPTPNPKQSAYAGANR